MSNMKKTHDDLEPLYRRVHDVLSEARNRVWQAVNSSMVASYWEIGRIIVEEEQRGESRAAYGKQIIRGLSVRLRAEFGKGFDQSNLWNMRAFFMAYPKIDALRRELTWTHYRLLLRLEQPDICVQVQTLPAHGRRTGCRIAPRTPTDRDGTATGGRRRTKTGQRGQLIMTTKSSPGTFFEDEFNLVVQAPPHFLQKMKVSAS